MLQINIQQFGSEEDGGFYCNECLESIISGVKCQNCREKMFVELQQLKRFPLKIEESLQIILDCQGNKCYFSDDGQYYATIHVENNCNKIMIFSFIEQKVLKTITIQKEIKIQDIFFSFDNTVLLLKSEFQQYDQINVYGLSFEYNKEILLENQKVLNFWKKNNILIFILQNSKDLQFQIYTIELKDQSIDQKLDCPFLWLKSMYDIKIITGNNKPYFYMFNQNEFKICSKQILKTLYSQQIENIISIQDCCNNGLVFVSEKNCQEVIKIKDNWNHKLIRKFNGFSQNSIIFQNLYIFYIEDYMWDFVIFYDIAVGNGVLQIIFANEKTGALTKIGNSLAFEQSNVFKGWKQYK